jgi:hypothetical protein
MSRRLMDMDAVEAVDADTDFVYGVRAQDGEGEGEGEGEGPAAPANLRIPIGLIGGGSGRRQVFDRGVIAGGTETPEPSEGELQVAVNGGGFDLAPPSETGFYRLVVTNGAAAAPIVPTGWDVVSADPPEDGEDDGEGASVLDEIGAGAVIEIMAANYGTVSTLQATRLLAPGSVPSGPQDALHDYVVLHASFEGAHEATEAVDHSRYAAAMTFGGGAEIDGNVSFYGGGSLVLNGTDAYVELASNVRYWLSGDYTVEGRFRWQTLAAPDAFRWLFGRWNAAADRRQWQLFHAPGGNMEWRRSADGSAGDQPILLDHGVSNLTAETFHHLAVTRRGATYRLLVDGVEVDDATDFEGVRNPSPAPVRFGASGNDTPGGFWAGHIEEVRITTKARYLGNFDPPTERFPRSGPVPPVRMTDRRFTTAVNTIIGGTWPGISFGPAAADRLLIISVAWNRNSSTDRQITGIAIRDSGGNLLANATRAIAAPSGTDTPRAAEIWYAEVPTETSGGVDFTFSGSILGQMTMTVYRATGLNSVTPEDTDGNTSAATATNVDHSAGGFAIACSAWANDSDNSLAGDIDNDLMNVHAGNANFRTAHGHRVFDAAGTASITPAGGRIVTASWR